MELRVYWKILWRRWWLVATPVIIVAIHTLLTYRPPAPVYQVVMRYAAGSEPAGLSVEHDRYYPWLTSEYIANGLADVAVTGAFAQAVSARLAQAGHDVPAAAIQPAIVSDNAQSILVIYLTWPDPEQITAVAEAVTAELTEGGAAYFPQMADVGPLARLLDPPHPIALAPGLRTQLMGPAIRIGLAFVVGAALAFLWHYLDPTLHERAELEALGVDVLAQIPRG